MGEKIQKVVKVLELAQSTYYPAFKRSVLCVMMAWRLGQDIQRAHDDTYKCTLRQQTHSTHTPVHACAYNTCSYVHARTPTNMHKHTHKYARTCTHTLTHPRHFRARRLLQEIELAREEANDNVKFLQPLRKYLEKLNGMDDFQALVDLFKPVFHTLALIWKHSRFYNNAARFVTLVQQACNDLIMQARNTTCVCVRSVCVCVCLRR